MHYYEKNIVEIKNEYTTFLINILTPFLYDGIKSLYDQSINEFNNINEKAKNTPNIVVPNILLLFQKFLKSVINFSNIVIENETNRIRNNSNCGAWFDDLVYAVIKSNIVLLTFSSCETSDVVDKKYHENININNFIHKCYIECAKKFYNYPELFWHKYSKLDIKKNQREIFSIIESSIKDAIRNSLPMNSILKEFNPLKNEGNSFHYDELNHWAIFYTIVRYMENYKFPFDKLNLFFLLFYYH